MEQNNQEPRAITIKIESPSACPYRIKGPFFKQYHDWDCLITRHKCNSVSDFPEDCVLQLYDAL